MIKFTTKEEYLKKFFKMAIATKEETFIYHIELPEEFLKEGEIGVCCLPYTGETGELIGIAVEHAYEEEGTEFTYCEYFTFA